MYWLFVGILLKPAAPDNGSEHPRNCLKGKYPGTPFTSMRLFMRCFYGDKGGIIKKKKTHARNMFPIKSASLGIWKQLKDRPKCPWPLWVGGAFSDISTLWFKAFCSVLVLCPVHSCSKQQAQRHISLHMVFAVRDLKAERKWTKPLQVQGKAKHAI